ncbi:hypothetical protein Tco_1368555 [Tanacetum coccineum]
MKLLGVILRHFPKKLGDPGQFLIHVEFLELMNACALADIGAEQSNATLRSEVISKWKFHSLNFEHRCCTTSPTLTPFEGSDFILEEIEAELSDTSYKSGIDDAEFPKRDIAWKSLDIRVLSGILYSQNSNGEDYNQRSNIRDGDSPWFDFDVVDTKGAENLAVDHLSRLENPHENELDPKEINEKFPLKLFSSICVLDARPLVCDMPNYHAGIFLIKRDVNPPRKNSSKTIARIVKTPVLVFLSRVSHPQLHFGNPETDIQEKEQKESQKQTNPSTEWKGQSQKSAK